MMDFPTVLLAVASDLDWLDPPPLFFGASVLEAYIDRKEMLDEELRPTEDVDVVFQIDKAGQQRVVVATVEQQLRQRGWKHDLRPRRRNQHAFVAPSGIPVDVVMDRLYSQDDWPIRASRSPEKLTLGPNHTLNIPTPAYFLACKIAASRSPKRWEGRYYSHDIEDVAVLLAGCSRLLISVESGPPELKTFIADWAAELLARQTPYGEAAYELVLGNAPRAAKYDELQTLLRDLAVFGQAPLG